MVERRTVSQVRKHPYRVNVLIGSGNTFRNEYHDCANLAGAIAFRDIALSQPLTQKVEVVMMIDESTPTR
jgi:hypothetical protein